MNSRAIRPPRRRSRWMSTLPPSSLFPGLNAMKTLKTTLCALLLCLLALPGLAEQQHIRWDATLSPPDARAGEGAQVVLHAKLDEGWHLYSLTQPDGGPYKTTIDLTPASTLEAGGDPVGPPFKTQHDKGFN